MGVKYWTVFFLQEMAHVLYTTGWANCSTFAAYLTAYLTKIPGLDKT